MKSPLKKSIGEVVTDYGTKVMKVFKEGLLGRSLFDFYGDVKALTFRTKEVTTVPTTPPDSKGGVIYTKSSDGKLYYKSNEVAEVELSASDTVLTSEQVQDVVGAMFSGNTETNITVTYQDADGTIDLAATDTNTTYSEATGSAEGLMSIAHHDKLDGIESSADVTDATNVTAAGALMDSELTDLAGVKGVTISTLQVKPSEGAFANGDKTKLDAIEASADVTDATNVTAAGALMDSELTDLSGIKSLDTSTLVTLAGTQTITGGKTFERAVILDGNKSITPGSDGVTLHVDAQDITDTNTSGSGTATTFNHVVVERPRLLAVNSSVTTTNASTVYIEGAPTAHTNQTITNAYALYIHAGNSYFGGAITANGGVTGDVTGNVSGSSGSCTGNSITATTATKSQGVVGAADADVNIVSDGEVIVKLDSDNDESLQKFKVTNNADSVVFSIDEGGTVFTSGGIITNSGTDSDLTIESDGSMTFVIDRDNDETSQSWSFKNYNVEVANLDESGNLQIDGGLTAQKITTTHDYHATTFENQIADDVGTGKILKYSPGANDTLNGSEIYFLHTDGTWNQADADDVATGASQMLGVGLGGSSQTVGCLIEGFIRIASTEILNTPGSGAVDGLPLYVSTTPGHFDFTAPSGSSDFVRIVGYALDDNSGDVLVYFNPDKTWVEIA